MNSAGIPGEHAPEISRGTRGLLQQAAGSVTSTTPQAAAQRTGQHPGDSKERNANRDGRASTATLRTAVSMVGHHVGCECQCGWGVLASGIRIPELNVVLAVRACLRLSHRVLTPAINFAAANPLHLCGSATSKFWFVPIVGLC